ncbi:MAG: hypothetical protein ABFC62_02720 [Clostridiaceae bacterium]|nr:hypothetical protein [Eubacteriales bacterium]
MNYLSDLEIDKIAGETGESLAREERVTVVIADPTGTGLPWEGGINGHFLRIRRGVNVSIPKSVAELIRQNERVTVLGAALVSPYKNGRGKKLGGEV